MVNVYIENDLKDLIDADTWAVGVEGITKETYIWAEDNNISVNLSSPSSYNRDVKTVVLIIHPSSRSTPARTLGSEVFSWTGDLKIYGNTIDAMKSAYDSLKILADADPNLIFHMGGINGSPKIKKYWSIIIYQWWKHVSH